MYIQATSWKLEEAIQLFYIGNDGGAAVASSPVLPVENDGLLPGDVDIKLLINCVLYIINIFRLP